MISTSGCAGWFPDPRDCRLYTCSAKKNLRFTFRMTHSSIISSRNTQRHCECWTSRRLSSALNHLKVCFWRVQNSRSFLCSLERVRWWVKCLFESFQFFIFLSQDLLVNHISKLPCLRSVSFQICNARRAYEVDPSLIGELLRKGQPMLQRCVIDNVPWEVRTFICTLCKDKPTFSIGSMDYRYRETNTLDCS